MPAGPFHELGHLAAAERAYHKAVAKAESSREYRNELIREALADGWTHAKIAEATGLTRGRIGQIAGGKDNDSR